MGFFFALPYKYFDAYMDVLLQRLNPDISQYRDRRFPGTQEEFEKCLKESTTLYIGNLSFYTTEEQIYEVPFGPWSPLPLENLGVHLPSAGSALSLSSH